MKRFVLLLVAIAAGLGCAELLVRIPVARDLVGRLLGRGELVAIADGVPIYRDETGADPQSSVIAQNLRARSAGEEIPEEQIERELNLLRFQFGDEAVFATARENAGLSADELREQVTEHLRARQWIEKQIASELRVTDEDVQQFYAANRAEFQQPPRFRASHVLLAAHEQTPPEQVEGKRKAIEALSRRLAKEKNLAQLATEMSEDEATKPRGGDLGFFAETRMLPEFFEEVTKLRVGEISAPFQTPLGFHIVQVTETKPARQLTLEELRPEIGRMLANENRVAAVENLEQQLSRAEYVRSAR